MTTSISRTTSNGTVVFNHENTMVVFMALECIDLGFGYEMYVDYMAQFIEKSIPCLPEPRYTQLLAIISNS